MNKTEKSPRLFFYASDLCKNYNYYNPSLTLHPMLYTKNYEWLFRTNESTFRGIYYPASFRFHLSSLNSQQILGLGERIKLPIEELQKCKGYPISQEANEILNEKNILFLDVNEITQGKNNKEKILNLPGYGVTDSNVLVPEEFKVLYSIYCSNVSKEFSMLAFEKSIDYIKSVLKSKNLTRDDINFYIAMEKVLENDKEKVMQRLQLLDRPQENDIEVSFLKDYLKQLKYLTKKNLEGKKSYKENIFENEALKKETEVKKILNDAKQDTTEVRKIFNEATKKNSKFNTENDFSDS